jgi:aldose 1-epimerase
MYTVTANNFGSLNSHILKNNETGEFVRIITGFGGNINELVLSKNNRRFSIIEGDKSEYDLRSEGGIKYKGAKLSPFPNRIKDGKYSFAGIKHQLKKNEKNLNALHGFLWDKPFSVTEMSAGDNNSVLVTEYKYDGKEEGYPFKYDLTVIYELNEKGFVCESLIRNNSEIAIPVADGWHPYFRTGSKIDDLILQLPSARMILTDEDLIPDGRSEIIKELNTGLLLGSRKFDNCFGPASGTGIVLSLITDVKNDLKIVLWQEAGKNKYNYVQVYTPDNRGSLVVEPMSCAPDAFNSGEGLIILEPKEEVSLKFGIYLE